MEYVPGRSLQDRLDQHGPLALPEVLRIGMQTAAGLAAAHAQGLVHRDVKPANILLENGVERVKLTDFGLARAAADAAMTQSGVVAGTPHYMAPEQARGEATDHRADLFSLGSTLYAMCTGHPPFRAETPLAVLRRVSDDEPRPLRAHQPGGPRLARGDRRPADRQGPGRAVPDRDRSRRAARALPGPRPAAAVVPLTGRSRAACGAAGPGPPTSTISGRDGRRGNHHPRDRGNRLAGTSNDAQPRTRPALARPRADGRA